MASGGGGEVEVSSARQAYAAFLRERHRPAHARRTADRVLGFLLPHVGVGARVLDVGCGPASVTIGLAEVVGSEGFAVGIDLDPGPAAVPLVRGDGYRLPFPDATFDVVAACAVLQHVLDPAALLAEARRVSRPGAVIGVADADWGGEVIHPAEPLIARAQEIGRALRAPADPDVGRRLRGLLTDAGFVDVSSTAAGRGGGGPEVAQAAEFEARLYDAPEVVAVVEEEGIADGAEMAAIAAAWRRWGADPAAAMARHWFEALGHVPA